MKRFAGSIAVVLMALAGCADMSAQPHDSGWITLLDGPKGFTENWDRIGDANWRIVDGVAQADAGAKGKSSYLMSKEAYGDFMLRAEFWVSDDANSGIYMRCPDLADIKDTNCTEANIFDQRPDPTYGTGAITNLSPIKNMPKAGGKWNTYEITARGPRIVVVLNGMQTGETDKANALRGNIGLQWAAGVVKFRKVEIKPL
ncbi:MAG TPA: DUF1080 domain-containing protein [Casimicrobiaceae bacterium]|nr:DUF1080 domain-containing protein [Casimicrobiaceae bacterium]